MLYPGNGKPLFEQLRDAIIQKITEGEYLQEDKLPSERQFAEKYNISRVTVRQALNQLVQEGVIIKKQGKGNFVAVKKIENKLDSLLGFVEEFSIKNRKCEVAILKKEYVIASPEISSAMKIDEDAKMLMVVRQIFVDNQSLGLDYTYVPNNVAYLLEGLDYKKDILYRVLEKNGFKLSTADQIITADILNPEEARLLKQTTASPVLVINRVAYVEGGHPIVYSKTVYLADRYQYKLTLKRDPIPFNMEEII
ncbi:MAG: GntR family transcriptional regulator [Eubacteriales bacterium]